jgi:hypothetical protein
MKSAFRFWRAALAAVTRSHGIRQVVAITGLLLGMSKTPTHAQWQQQSIALRPGWNAVFLEVQPAVEDCDAVFTGMPIDSVWDFNRVVDLPQFVQDPTTLVPGAPGWLTWFPPNHPLAGQGSLFTLRDGRPYLVKVATNAAPFTWTIVGRPSLRPSSWAAGGMNLAGFHVGSIGPSFQTLFAGEAGLVSQPVYSLDAAGVWRRILDLANTRVRANESYWIRCTAPAQRSGTILVDPGSRQGMEFASGQTEQLLRIRNTSAGARTITLRLLTSATPPPGQAPSAGPVPLQYWRSDYAATNFEWAAFPPTLAYTALPSGQEWHVRLGAKLTDIPVSPGARYQSVLEVVDDAGTRWLVPLSARPPGDSSPAGFAAASVASSFSGIWVGDAVLNAVSQPARPSNPHAPRPAGQFTFRLILHVDGNGTARLLQSIYLVRKPAVLAPDPGNPEFNREAEPARVLALTDESLIPSLVGSGEIAGRRISSTAFGFKDPVVLSGGAFGAGAISGTVPLDFNHPLNPFKHRHHPDHNNLDERFENTLPEGRESFAVTRNITLSFGSTDPLGLHPPGWGQSELGGAYTETLTGLHRHPLHVAGTFRLVRVAMAPVLNQ